MTMGTRTTEGRTLALPGWLWGFYMDWEGGGISGGKSWDWGMKWLLCAGLTQY